MKGKIEFAIDEFEYGNINPYELVTQLRRILNGNIMKKFIIINGMEITLLQKESLAEARNHAINVCNHSKEVLVREVEMGYKLDNYE